MKWRNIIGWLAIAISTLLASFWAFWGSIENFHEGWYYTSFWTNVGMMLVQYLSAMLFFIVLGVVSIRWPRCGSGAHIAIGILLPLLVVRTHAAIYLISLPLTGVATLYWFGRPQPTKWAYRLVVGIPLLVVLGFGIEPAIRVSGRLDDGNYQAQIVAGNEVKLMWAPEGPGWPTQGHAWHEAVRVCQYLSADGKTVAATVQNIWRLPTVEETVRSLTRHGTNAGGTWDSAAQKASYKIMPDKESPLWKVHSPIIYWWTSTEVSETTAYRVVYNGGVHVFPKKTRMCDFSFRAVKEVK